MLVRPGPAVTAVTLTVEIVNEAQIGSSPLTNCDYLTQLLEYDAVEVTATNVIIYPLLIMGARLLFHVKENNLMNNVSAQNMYHYAITSNSGYGSKYSPLKGPLLYLLLGRIEMRTTSFLALWCSPMH